MDALQFIEEKKNLIETNDLNQLIEDDNFNDLDDRAKNDIFYMAAFFKSTKKYNHFKQLKEAIDDLEMIIDFINNNEYLHRQHECFEMLMNNYLNSMDDLLNPCLKKDQEAFIQFFHQFVEIIQKINFYNDNCRKGVIKELKNIQDSLSYYARKIDNKYKEKFTRYFKDLGEYIQNQENIKDNNFNEYLENEDEDKEIKIQENSFENENINVKNNLGQIDNVENEIDFKIFTNDSYNDFNKDNNKNIIRDKINLNLDENNYFDNPMKNEINENNENKNNFNNLSKNNLENNKFIQNNNNNKNKIAIDNNININNNDEEFPIINNQNRIFDIKNSLNDSKKYFESMMPKSITNSINEIVEAENKKEEEEKVEEINEEINNFINELKPLFFSQQININQEKINFLKQSYLKSENLIENKSMNNNININLNSFQNINNNNNIIINNSNKPVKKKKKGKKKKKQ